jgi:3'-phosphoadenosine 5'-phosphosulfate sulfotransferase (PAPS reductase)/FAD synthetase
MPTTYHLLHPRTLKDEAGLPSTASLRRSATRRGTGSGHAPSASSRFAGQYHRHSQRLEVWSLYNGRIREGQQARIFPISDWTELDVWQYIAEEALEVPSICFAHGRGVFARDGLRYAVSPFVELIDGEQRQGCF